MLPPIDLVIMQAAGSAQAHPKPSWTEPLLIAGMAVIGVGFVATDRVEDRRAQRRIYWAAWTLAGVLFAVALAFRGWAVMVAAFALAVFAALVYAYFLTGYLKIGRRIVAFSNRNTRPDPPRDGSTAQPPRIRDRDAYPGDIPASRVWWVIALLMAGLAVGLCLAVGQPGSRSRLPLSWSYWGRSAVSTTRLAGCRWCGASTCRGSSRWCARSRRSGCLRSPTDWGI